MELPTENSTSGFNRFNFRAYLSENIKWHICNWTVKSGASIWVSSSTLQAEYDLNRPALYILLPSSANLFFHFSSLLPTCRCLGFPILHPIPEMHFSLPPPSHHVCWGNGEKSPPSTSIRYHLATTPSSEAPDPLSHTSKPKVKGRQLNSIVLQLQEPHCQFFLCFPIPSATTKEQGEGKETSDILQAFPITTLRKPHEAPQSLFSPLQPPIPSSNLGDTGPKSSTLPSLSA